MLSEASSRCKLGILPFLSLVSYVLSQSIPGASLFSGGGIPGSGAYELVDDYQPSVFFSKFNYYNSYDPTYGHVQYVNESVANTNGYATTNNGSVTISVDTTNKWPRNGPGRPAVRLISDNTYTHGLFVLDLSHMPYGCGTWPAFWLLGPDWPTNGEIDIIEGVHTSLTNTVSMHTSANCTVAGSGQTGIFTNANCDKDANDNSGCGSVSNNTATPNNYGKGLGDNGGGVYLTEWTSAYVRVWFFPRQNIPASITRGSPDISEFGLPMANFQGSCDIDSHFANNSIIINTDFCGAWAGFAYSSFPDCPLTNGSNGYDSCVDYVGNNPQMFVDAYWEINSIKVYQLPADISSSYVPTSTAPLTSSSPISANNSVVNPGLGQSTSSLPLSVPYTGPLSSVSSSTTTSSATVSATPIICPAYDNSPWTDYNGVNWSISCDSNFIAASLNGAGQATNSFEACIELCDTTVGCSGVSYVGGNGAGTCVLKSGDGDLQYDGHTFAAVAMTNSSSSSTTSAATLTVSTPPKTATLRPTAQPSTCPQANNIVYVDENVVSYIVYCSSDTKVDSFNSTTIDGGGFTACFTICDVTPGCVGFTFVGASSGMCYFKNQYGGTILAPDDYVVAFLSSGQTSGIAAQSSAMATSSIMPNPTYSNISASAQSSALSVWSSSVSISVTSSSSQGRNESSQSTLTPSPLTTAPSSNPGVVYYVAPPCPTTVDSICNSDAPTTCSNARGANFNVDCGNSYLGTTIANNNGMQRFRILKRVTEPSYTDCLDLCDDTDGCVGVNYKGDECTLFSQITGTIPDPSNVAATLLPPIPVTSTAATSSPTAAMASGTSGASSAATWPAFGPTCPGSTGQTYTDSNGSNYTIACSVDIQGGDLSSPFRAASIAGCLPSCDVTAGCLGVVYDTAVSSCQMKYTFAGNPVPNENIIVAERASAADPGLSSSSSSVSSLSVSTTTAMASTTVSSSTVGVSSSSSTALTITTSYPASATVTIVSTLITTGTSPNASLTTGTESTGSGSLCFTCFLTPTVVTGGATIESPPVHSGTGSSSACIAQPSGSIGTTTVFTTEIVTACPTPGMCPPEAFGWAGSMFGSNFSTFSVTPQTSSTASFLGGYNGFGGSATTGGASNASPSNAASPTPACPSSDGVKFTGSLGQVYEIGCGRYITDTTVSTTNVSSLVSCIGACDMYNIMSFNSPSPCVGVSFFGTLASSNCELKGGYTNVTSPGVDSASLLSRSPGAGNATTGTGGTGGNGDYGSGSAVGSSAGATNAAGSGGPGTGAGTGPGTGPGTAPGSTVYGVSTAVSTIVSNGQSILSTYGVSTALSVIYQPTTRTVTTTTVSISVSISDRTVVTTAPGQTVSVGGGTDGGVVTITLGGGNFITVTQVVTSYVAPSSSSYSFTCRTYATNYLNGMHGRKLAKRRSVFDKYGMGQEGEGPLAPKPGARP